MSGDDLISQAKNRISKVSNGKRMEIKHAIRAYRNALSVFKGTTWSHIRDHVHFHIGQWYAFLGRYDMAMKHMLEIVACSHQSEPMQELYMNFFFGFFRKLGLHIKFHDFGCRL